MLSRFLDWHIELTVGASCTFKYRHTEGEGAGLGGGRMVRMMKSIGI